MPRILICDKLEPDGLAVLEKACLDVDNRPGLKGDELRAALQAADGAIIRLGTRITADLLDDPGKLRIIVRAGAGVDNVDVVAATRKGVIVINTPHGNTLSACEYTWGMILTLVRQIPAANAVMHQGGWDRSKFVGMQLAGKTLGIIGLGRIGREVATRALAMEMKVIGYDPIVAADRMTSLGLRPSRDIETVLREADIVTLHVPLNPETRELIGAEQLAMMKKGSFLINCARGGIVDEGALVAALQSGHLAGAALDVFAQEPPPADHPLRALPNVVLTPHLGAATTEAQRSVAVEAAEVMVDFFSRSQNQFSSHADADQERLRNLKPYLNAAHRLGLLVSQIQEGTIECITLSFQGELPSHGMSWLSSSFAVGLLETRLSERLTPMNALLLAKERGINIIEDYNPACGDYSFLLSVELKATDSRHTVSATLFSNQYVQLVQMDGFHLEANLDGNLLIITNRDLPGLLGHIGTVLCRHGVSIAKIAAGRKIKSDEAVAILNLDHLPSEAIMTEFRSLEQINSVDLIHLPAAGEIPVWLR